MKMNLDQLSTCHLTLNLMFVCQKYVGYCVKMMLSVSTYESGCNPIYMKPYYLMYVVRHIFQNETLKTIIRFNIFLLIFSTSIRTELLLFFINTLHPYELNLINNFK